MADEQVTPPVPAVVAQEAKTVGDEAVNAEVHAVEPEVVQEEADAQVSQPREAESDTVNVHEVYVATDRAILDPSDPLAVQIPDAGRGSLDLPIHALAGPHVEDVFNAETPEEDEQPVEEPTPPANPDE